MSENMAAKVWQQGRICFKVVFEKNIIVAIPQDALQCFIKGTLMLHKPVPINEDEIVVPINSCLAFNTIFYLVLPFHFKSLLYL